jgi:predicted aspartyl protease
MEMSSYFMGTTPVIEIAIENPFLSARYPESGGAISVLDTGYEGFAMVPKDVFEDLKFNEMYLHRREIILPTEISLSLLAHTEKLL